MSVKALISLSKFNIKKFIFLFFIFVFFDRLSKVFAWQILYSHLHNFTNYFFRPRLNAVLAFSLPAPEFLIFILNLLILFFLFFWLLILIKEKKYNQVFLLCLLIYGGFSNLFDRLFYKGVIDFIYLGFLSVFNLADIYITISVLLLLYLNFKNDKKYQC